MVTLRPRPTRPPIANDRAYSRSEPRFVEQSIAELLASRTFARATLARQFVRYIVSASLAGGSDRLREASIELDVFRCDAARYDQANDPIVRVSANRQRVLLERYYENESADAPWRTELPRRPRRSARRACASSRRPPLRSVVAELRARDDVELLVRSPGCIMIGAEPLLRGLHADARWPDLLARMGRQ